VVDYSRPMAVPYDEYFVDDYIDVDVDCAPYYGDMVAGYDPYYDGVDYNGYYGYAGF